MLARQMTGWRTLIGVGSVAALLSACGAFGAAPPPPAEPSVSPTSVPTVPRAAASPSPSSAPLATQAPSSTATAVALAPTNTVWVGNTDGQGVFVRTTPVMADRVRAYVDGTPLTIVGDDVDGDGQHWKHVKTPDGLDGYVPAVYTVDTPP